MFITFFVLEHFWKWEVYYACLCSAIAQILNGDFNVFLLFYIIINKMKHQITENEENLFIEKMPRCQ